MTTGKVKGESRGVAYVHHVFCLLTLQAFFELTSLAGIEAGIVSVDDAMETLDGHTSPLRSWWRCWMVGGGKLWLCRRRQVVGGDENGEWGW